MFRLHSILAAALICTVTTAHAQDADAGFLVELNKATEKNGACEIVIFAHNHIGQPLSNISLKLAVVDAAGKFNSMLSLPLGAMRDDDSKFASYTLRLPCTGMSKVVINEVDNCTLAESGQESPMCDAALKVNSREAGIEMVL